ncbi:Mediator of RNA polymerase II transcription subunit 21 [Psidium guajava]|nr:Mediator of RNA polymerase II transcription subunit 21 [Psidium guajava]
MTILCQNFRTCSSNERPLRDLFFFITFHTKKFPTHLQDSGLLVEMITTYHFHSTGSGTEKRGFISSCLFLSAFAYRWTCNCPCSSSCFRRHHYGKQKKMKPAHPSSDHWFFELPQLRSSSSFAMPVSCSDSDDVFAPSICTTGAALLEDEEESLETLVRSRNLQELTALPSLGNKTFIISSLHLFDFTSKMMAGRNVEQSAAELVIMRGSSTFLNASARIHTEFS